MVLTEVFHQSEGLDDVSNVGYDQLLLGEDGFLREVISPSLRAIVPKLEIDLTVMHVVLFHIQQFIVFTIASSPVVVT